MNKSRFKPQMLPRLNFLIMTACAFLAGCATSRQAPPNMAKPQQAIVATALPTDEPADLAGLKSTQLREIFGPPSFVRKEGAMELWRYDTTGCKAFFFLYPYGPSLLVKHVETLPRGSARAADQTCLDTLHPKDQAPTPTS